MERRFLLGLWVMLLFVPLHVSGQELNERVIISFQDNIDYGMLEEAVEVHYVFEDLRAVSATISSEMKERLLTDDRVAYMEKDPVVTSMAQGTNWGYRHLSVERTNASGLTGEGVKIGILDTGIDLAHPDLNIAGGVSFVKDSATIQDKQGHGTHVAGIIAAQDNDFGVVGVAPEAEIYGIKVLDESGEGNLSDVIAGINWAIKQDLDIINLSITSEEDSALLMNVLDKAYAEDILIIAASGNIIGYGYGIKEVLYPARYESAIAVGSIDNDRTRSSFSYYGSDLEFVAPGDGILSTYPSLGKGSYVELSGTSMATAFVTGVAALYKQKYPALSNTELRKVMQENAIDLGKPGKDSEYGYGLISAPIHLSIYVDIHKEDWFEGDVQYLNKRAIVTGYPNGRFYPANSITRAEAVTMIGRAIGLASGAAETMFPDVSTTHFASGFIHNASNQGIIGGYPDGTFKPNAYITRGDVAVILQRAFHIPYVTDTYYQDVEDSKYYADAVNSLTSAGISGGYPNGTFQPEKNITRAEFSSLLAKALRAS